MNSSCNDKFLKQAFFEHYPKSKDASVSFCPYRVCPIGAHIDHQYGKVTGFAIDKGISVFYSPNDEEIVRCVSTSFEGAKQFSIHDIPKKQNDWADYLRGATFFLSQKYELHTGLNALIGGSLPIGGLSSSAAVIISFLSALCRVNNIRLSEKEVIDTALKAENIYVGVSCGKLDQSCEVYCKKDKLLYLDPKDDSFELIDKSESMKPYQIAIFFSGIERALVSSAFNTRVDELKSTSYALKAYSQMEYGKFADTRMRDVPEEIFRQYKDKLPENWAKRAEHYYSESRRVELAVDAWRKGDIISFGKLSFESCLSSINYYESGSEELKKLYNIMLETDGIYGGRFSGAGFKGCCFALVDPAFKESIENTVTQKYLKEYPNLKEKFSVHFCDTADGIKLD